MAEKTGVLTIKAPNFETIALRIKGISPYMQSRFSVKAMQAMMAAMAAGGTAKSKKKRDPRDFDANFRDAQHISTEGWNGMPCSAIRSACISACRTVGFKMTLAKLSIFVEPDGLDVVDGMPLVKLDAPPPERSEMAARNDNGGTDIRVRPLWREWAATVRIRFDADQFTANDVVNLLARAGAQVGIGEGRPDSRESNGLGFGMFEVKALA